MSTVSTSRSTGQEADSAQGGNEMSLTETKREAWLTKMLSFYDLGEKNYINSTESLWLIYVDQTFSVM